jgi:hypothetical protein
MSVQPVQVRPGDQSAVRKVRLEGIQPDAGQVRLLQFDAGIYKRKTPISIASAVLLAVPKHVIKWLPVSGFPLAGGVHICF